MTSTHPSIRLMDYSSYLTYQSLTLLNSNLARSIWDGWKNRWEHLDVPTRPATNNRVNHKISTKKKMYSDSWLRYQIMLMQLKLWGEKTSNIKDLGKKINKCSNMQPDREYMENENRKYQNGVSNLFFQPIESLFPDYMWLMSNTKKAQRCRAFCTPHECKAHPITFQTIPVSDFGVSAHAKASFDRIPSVQSRVQICSMAGTSPRRGNVSTESQLRVELSL